MLIGRRKFLLCFKQIQGLKISRFQPFSFITREQSRNHHRDEAIKCFVSYKK